MRRLLMTVFIVCVAVLPTWAQEEATPEPTIELTYRVTLDSVLEVTWLGIENRLSPYGDIQPVVRGELYNSSDSTAYTDISLFAFAYAVEGDEEPVAEGFGYPVTICGFSPLDFTIAPMGKQYFDIPLELYGDDTSISHLEMQVAGNISENAPITPAPIPNITQISDDEVVSVEFPREAPFRYAVGCEKLPFTAWTWYGYNPDDGSFDMIQHPGIEQITEQTRERMRLKDDAEFNHSFTSIAPISRRVIYQSGVNHFYTAQPDGSNRRYVHQDLSRFSLQGIIWTTESDAFLAYYFGAYGEKVRYFSARASSEWISRSAHSAMQSFTVPGPNSQATEVIITTDELGPIGYYVKHTFLTANELMFEADPPGNNYPAPVWIQRGSRDLAYIARPIDGIPTLQCYNFRSEVLTTLTPLPLNLTENDRAWMWVSPDDSVLMLSQNGIAGGLWQVDLTALPECE
jgi:hypothetical protein